MSEGVVVVVGMGWKQMRDVLNCEHAKSKVRGKLLIFFFRIPRIQPEASRIATST